MIFSLSAFEDSTTLGGGILSIEVLSVDVSTLRGGVLMVNGLSMIAVLIAVHYLNDLLILFDVTLQFLAHLFKPVDGLYLTLAMTISRHTIRQFLILAGVDPATSSSHRVKLRFSLEG